MVGQEGCQDEGCVVVLDPEDTVRHAPLIVSEWLHIYT
jgi:hypothetical protein